MLDRKERTKGRKGRTKGRKGRKGKTKGRKERTEGRAKGKNGRIHTGHDDGHYSGHSCPKFCSTESSLLHLH